MKYILILILIFIIPLCLAETEIYEVNKESELKFTCTLNDAIPSVSTQFNITISYPNGSVFINNKLATPQGLGSFNYTVTFTQIGTYKVQMFCYDGTYSYSNEGFYIITTTGQQVSLSNIILVITFLLIAGLLFIIGYSFDKEKYIIKSSFYLFSLLMGLLTINSARIIASESLNLSPMASMGLIFIIGVLSFMFLFVLIYYTIQTVKSFKRKEGIRWEY